MVGIAVAGPAGAELPGVAGGAGLPGAGEIQGAIDRAEPGEVVRLPAGRIELSRALKLREGVALVGAGRDETVLHYAGEAAAILELAGVSGVTLRGFALDGRGSRASVGIAVSDGRGHRLEGLGVAHLAEAGDGPLGIAFGQGVTDSVIAGCEIVDIGVDSEWGAGVRLSWGSSRNRVEGNVISRTGRGGILANDGCVELVIRGNVITKTGLAGDGLDFGLGIELWNGSHDSIVEDNRLDRWLSIDTSHRVAVRRNRVDPAGGMGAFIGLELVDSHGVVFSDNVVEPGTHLGVSVSGDGVTRRALFLRNRVTGADTWAVQLQGDARGDAGFYFRENVLERTTPDADTLYGEFGLQGDAVRLNSDVSRVVFDRNRIEHNAGRAFEVLPPGVGALLFVGNQVAGNGDDAEPASDAAAGPAVRLEVEPARAEVGEPVRLVLRFENEGVIEAVVWDDGIGAAVETKAARWSRSYGREGTYPVAAVVWFADGRASFGQGQVVVTGPGLR